MEILTTQVSQRRWTSWSSGPEPAYAVLNTAVWQWGAAPPFDPQLFAPLPGRGRGGGGPF